MDVWVVASARNEKVFGVYTRERRALARAEREERGGEVTVVVQIIVNELEAEDEEE
jgi:alkanesulfonate monooxygenase SsuD/methylene tetrahydromethanopterin reductase-like flavin-dependent oxidoreductase (luciferase family)